ncbi:MAG: hypothetical protein WC702_04780 [Patescibacteria group bacterium]|jgi:hypothetical protein
MPKIVLIHGFAAGLTAPFIRPPFGPSASFEAFKELVEKGEAVSFPWGIEQQVNPLKLLNPLFLLGHYEKERALAQARETHERLKTFLEQIQPEKIICHSMGCFLLNNYLENFSLPKSVKAIVFSQSDDTDFPFPSSSSSPSNPSSPFIHNLYCPWDPTLWVSCLYHKKQRAGLWPARQTSVKNVFVPLVRPINFHTNTICDPWLVDYVSKL